MTEAFIHLDHGEYTHTHIPEGMRPNVQLGTRMPNGLCVSLSSVVGEDLGSSDFGLTPLTGVHWLPTTKDSVTVDLDSISVTAGSEFGAKVLAQATTVVAGVRSVAAGVGERCCCRPVGLVSSLSARTHEIEIDGSSVRASGGDFSVVAIVVAVVVAVVVGSTSCESLVGRCSTVVITKVVNTSMRDSGVESLSSFRTMPSLCFSTAGANTGFEPSSPLWKSADEKMWVGRWM